MSGEEVLSPTSQVRLAPDDAQIVMFVSVPGSTVEVAVRLKQYEALNLASALVRLSHHPKVAGGSSNG